MKGGCVKIIDSIIWSKNDFFISTDKKLLDFDVIHSFISQKAYWGLGRSKEVMERAIDNSRYCFGLYHTSAGDRKQIGFARFVTDLATFGYLADVFVLEEYRGQGLGRRLIETIIGHPDLKELKRITLFTRTPGFYEIEGFKIWEPANESSTFMVLLQAK